MSKPVCPHTLSFPALYEQQHLSFDLDVDFRRSVVKGNVTVRFRALKEVERVVLDTNGLNIKGVEWKESGAAQKSETKKKGKKDKKKEKKGKKGKKEKKKKEKKKEEEKPKEGGPIRFTLLPFAVGPSQPPFGDPLTVHLPHRVASGSQFQLRITYETTSESGGLQWLPPRITEGKKHPYMFSQFQAIHARSFVPCQDTPGVKITYDARLRVPRPLTALMSALSTGRRQIDADTTEFSFEQKVPIPTYLIALAVGNIVGKKVGRLSTVWCEPERIEAAAWEFEEVDRYIDAANAITKFPYEEIGWGKYDMLVLPGSFPYGGMENPCLTFLTPTLLAGDRSQVSVVAHELAHSWFGNLLTTVTWEHFWLNEGFTTYLERRIIRKVHGSAQQDGLFVEGNARFQESLKRFANGDRRALSLVQDMTGSDPDDLFSSVYYEKGSQFLLYLERAIVKDEALFDEWLSSWISLNRYGTVSSHAFVKHFKKFFSARPGVRERLDSVDWDTWLNERDEKGCPVDVLELCDKSLVEKAARLAEAWKQKGSKGRSSKDVQNWSSFELMAFLDELDAGDISKKDAAAMGKLYGFPKVKHAEIRYRWLMIALQLSLSSEYSNASAFLREQGRMKYVRPLFRAWASTEDGKPLAEALFRSWRSNYHPICEEMVAKDLKIED